jgi:CheY-like chemotaxis protein
MNNTATDKRLEELMREADGILAKLHSQTIQKEKKSKLLIVEDEPGVVEGLKNMFEDDYELHVCYDATSALAVLRHTSVDAAILDMKLPDMHGFELLKQVKKINPHLPIVVNTGYPGEYPEAVIRELGSSFYVEKGDPRSTQKLTDFTKTVTDAYQSFKREIIQALISDFSNKKPCSYSALFNPEQDVVLSDGQVRKMSIKEIAANAQLVPLCYLSIEFADINKEEGTRICPFHNDADARYNTGTLSSHPCSYYSFASKMKIDEAIIATLQKKSAQNGKP